MGMAAHTGNPSIRMKRQENQEFKVISVDTGNSRPVCVTCTHLKKEKQTGRVC